VRPSRGAVALPACKNVPNPAARSVPDLTHTPRRARPKSGTAAKAQAGRQGNGKINIKVKVKIKVKIKIKSKGQDQKRVSSASGLQRRAPRGNTPGTVSRQASEE